MTVGRALSEIAVLLPLELKKIQQRSWPELSGVHRRFFV
jgi:hypothetical protein